jgi:osmotically inducible lipoprotein OsmB
MAGLANSMQSPWSACAQLKSEAMSGTDSAPPVLLPHDTHFAEEVTMRVHAPPAILVVGSLVLSACGTSPGSRALTGAGIGAAGGAALGALGGNPAAGAVAGAAAGAAVGGLTSPNQVYAGQAPGCE